MNIFQRVAKMPHLKAKMIGFFLSLALAAWASIALYEHYYVSTDDAYVNANVVQIAPRITGQVVKLYVKNNTYVKKGQPLFDIDAQPFNIAVASALAEKNIRQAELDNIHITAERTLALVKRHFSSAQSGDDVLTQIKTAQGALDLAKAKLDQALLNLSFTKVSAPFSGWVTNVSLQSGDIIAANQPLFALISDEEFWIDANFKETEIKAIKPGQVAVIKTDMYPQHIFKGKVESISGGAGTAFSLLPPQNATGNWVKVTQRIPIRIHVLNPNAHYPLRIGASATVTVNLKKTA